MQSELSTNLQPYIIGYFFVFDQTSYKVEVSVTSGRVGDLNLLDSAFNNCSEERGFLFNSHGVRQSLISISKISRQPDGSLDESF